MNRVYHIGIIDRYNGKEGPYSRTGTVEVQARSCVDSLDCEILEYCGERETTKANLRANKQNILAWINGAFGYHFTKITIS